MMNTVYAYILAALTVFALCACDVHEFPSEQEEPKPACTLLLRPDNDGFDFLATVSTGTRSAAHTLRDLRVTVRVYPLEPGANSSTRVPTRSAMEIYSATFADDGSHPDLEIPLRLPPGEYQVVAWADHVEKGSDRDLYYTAADFLEIRLPGSGEPGYAHKGNDPYREAWRGSLTISVGTDGAVYLPERPAEKLSIVEMTMERPLARYHFITTDYRKFIEAETGKLAPGATQAPDLNGYRVVVRYTGYMSCAYNALSDKPMDSATGVCYDGIITPMDHDRAQVAFDHLFVNHMETSAQVALELYRRSDGTRLSSTGVINVPLRRGHYTLIEGPLLTTDAGASAGIVPDFFGDFNIEIH